MTPKELTELRDKAELYDLWEHAHLHVESVYDFDNTMSADELKQALVNIINLESYGEQ